ncbi:MAG: MBL fold metallo-hydrolase [Verrucomicrobiota bacterium]
MPKKKNLPREGNGREIVFCIQERSGYDGAVSYNRRRFIATTLVGGVVAGAGLWTSASNSWAARFLRERITESFREITPVSFNPHPAEWDSNKITLSWIGHATVLINFYGFWILTDPALFSRVGLDLRLFSFGPKRLSMPGLQPNLLPKIDLILLSHAHMDHMDLPSLRALPAETPAVTAWNTADILKGTLSQVSELRWGESIEVKRPIGNLKVTAFEVNHWGARWQRDQFRGYNGYVLEREGKKLIFGGDTALTSSFQRLRSQGPYEIAIMPIGAYDPWIRVHCNPEQAAQMAFESGAKKIAPVHFKTFKLSREPLNEPIERLQRACAQELERIAWREIGEAIVL